MIDDERRVRGVCERGMLNEPRLRCMSRAVGVCDVLAARGVEHDDDGRDEEREVDSSVDDSVADDSANVFIGGVGESGMATERERSRVLGFGSSSLADGVLLIVCRCRFDQSRDEGVCLVTMHMLHSLSPLSARVLRHVVGMCVYVRYC
jgi:hypothetical protein